MESIQSEVATEASPFLAFLFRNAKQIVLFFVLFLFAIAGYWIYSGQQAKSRLASINELGKIIINTNDEERFSLLEKYIDTAPESVQNEALFSLATTAQQIGNYDVAYATWETLGKKFPEINVQATFGKVKSLMAQEKKQEALALLNGLVPSLKAGTAEVVSVNSIILSIAEVLKDYDRAIIACEALVSSPNTSEGSMFWQQKLFELKQKADAKKVQQK